jgi:hypothetical protein
MLLRGKVADMPDTSLAINKEAVCAVNIATRDVFCSLNEG